MPVPVNASAVGESAPLLPKEIVAEAVPEVAGVNVTVKDGDVSPAARVKGREIPESTNSLLLLLAAETVTDDPVASRVAVIDFSPPTRTLPKLRLDDESDN